MTTKVIFVHGLFQTGKSWQHWVNYFSARGFNCAAPSWPCHEGEPEELRRRIPLRLGRLRLDEVVEKFAVECLQSDHRPVVIGHSVGGLVAQKLAARGLASAAVCISSVAPNDLSVPDWGLLRNIMTITNPLKGDEPFQMTPEFFHETFANTMVRADSDVAFEQTATHDSRQVLRDCLSSTGYIDLSEPHVPLLFIGAHADRLVPASLSRRNCGRYSDLMSITEFKEFSSHGHLICFESGWQEIAAFTYRWICSEVDEIKVNEAAGHFGETGGGASRK